MCVCVCVFACGVCTVCACVYLHVVYVQCVSVVYAVGLYMCGVPKANGYVYFCFHGNGFYGNGMLC